jgi:hypothetical protein
LLVPYRDHGEFHCCGARDAFFTALFAALSGFALTIAMRQGGEN